MANDAHDNAQTDKDALKNYGDYVKRPQSDDALAVLSQLAEDQLAAQIRVAATEKALADSKEELRLIAEVAVPELMDQLGMREFTTTSGIKIKVDMKIRASINAQKQMEAFQWMRDNNHESLIKRVIAVQFGMGEDAEAQAALEKLEGLPVQDKSTVHNGTLVKFVKEMLATGQDVPEELFNIHQQRITKVKI